MKRNLFIGILLLLIASCSKVNDPVINYPAGFDPSGSKGLFLLNEGNFNRGNGSVSFFSYDSLTLFNNVFSVINSRPLGDTPNSINISNDKVFIIVNNSGKIEILDTTDLVSVATIRNLVSPRNISFVNSSKAYITSLYSDSITIIDTKSLEIKGFINIKHSTESILTISSKSFAANWAGGNKIFIIDNTADVVIDSIEVGMEPESIVCDRNKMLWILCNGGWAREKNAELCCYNTQTGNIERRLIFQTLDDSPSCLQVDGSGETLFYLNKGVWRINILDTELPDEAFIPESGRLFYRMSVNPANGEIFVTDAVNYQDKGYLLRYDSDGELISEYQADVNPGAMFYK